MKKIAIIGGGISGLCIANLFRQNPDYEITVFEKNNSINLEKGYGIQLSVNSIRLLNKIGFHNIPLNEKFHPNKIDFYSLKSKKKISDLDISSFNDSEAKYTTLQRSTLINFFKDRLPDNLINYNKKIKNINQRVENIELTFQDNSTIESDYLIVSDGVFSETKSLIANREIKPKYFNSIAVRATINQNELQEIDLNNISLFPSLFIKPSVFRNIHGFIFGYATIPFLDKSFITSEFDLLSNSMLFFSIYFVLKSL